MLRTRHKRTHSIAHRWAAVPVAVGRSFALFPAVLRGTVVLGTSYCKIYNRHIWYALAVRWGFRRNYYLQAVCDSPIALETGCVVVVVVVVVVVSHQLESVITRRCWSPRKVRKTTMTSKFGRETLLVSHLKYTRRRKSRTDEIKLNVQAELIKWPRVSTQL